MTMHEEVAPERHAWRISDWAEETTFSTSYVRALIKQGLVRSVKAGKFWVILTPPREYLEGLEAGQ